MNRVILIGNLGKDPELTQVGNGQQLCRYPLATSDRVKSGDEWVDRTEWHNVIVWGKQADNCAKYISKGSKVAIEGKLHTSSWDQDGVTRYRTEVVALRVEFLSQQPQQQQKPLWKQNKNDDIPF
jgi:single-strand DNA-binding protein